MNTHEVVTVRGLRKSYGGRAVVSDLDLDVFAGEVVGLIGANGAGKTTTVECLQGLRRPDAGEIRVLGLDPATNLRELRQVMGSQLQDSALPDRLRVGEAVELFASSARNDGRALIERFGLQARVRSAFASLSGGERQRLFLVLALLNQPRLVILDELTQGLDPAARRDVWQAVRQLRDDGTTVLLVTHELADAEVLCDRVVAMRAGTILDQGPPRDLVDRHGRRATIRFTLPEGNALLADLAALPSVESIGLDRGQQVLKGSREMIAYVGAAMVQSRCIPKDLSVHVPDLEGALLELLEPVGAGQ